MQPRYNEKHIGHVVYETSQTITRAELHLEKIRKQLKMTLAMPERNTDFGGDGQNCTSQSTTVKSPQKTYETIYGTQNITRMCIYIYIYTYIYIYACW